MIICVLPVDKISLFPLRSHSILNDMYVYIIVYISLAYFLFPVRYRLVFVRKVRLLAYSPALSKHGGLEQTIIKNNELALFHEGNVLESLRLECRKGRKKGGGGKEGRERERELRG